MAVVKFIHKYKSALVKCGLFGVGIVLLYVLYSLLLSPTKIALINFPSYQATNIILANESHFIQIDDINPENLPSLNDYDAILIFARGLAVTGELSDNLDKAAKKGKMIYTFSLNGVTTINQNIDTIQQLQLENYYRNRCKVNTTNMLNYIRHEFDSKKLFSASFNSPVTVPSDMFYYLEEGQFYNSAEELTDYLKKNNLYKENGQRIALISGITYPLEGNRSYVDSLITNLSKSGFNIYPIAATSKRLDFMKAVHPDAVVYLPMGRLGDESVKWLTDNNIPLFCPIPMMQSHEEWINDNKGAIGGQLTARIVLPEIDGGMSPLVVATQNLHDNYYTFDPEPERLQNIVDHITKYMSLRRKQNKDKRVAICYFKAPGQSSLLSSGLETAPSLYNLLKRLKQEGYTVNNLPANESDFEKLLMTQGAVLGAYAEGSQAEFMKNGNPLWISKMKYEEWAKSTFTAQKYNELVNIYGEAPGKLMSGVHNGEAAIAVARLDFGNIVLFPQPRAAVGDDDFKIVHGADVAPPHSYIAPYLWIQKEFKADALIHFGTHGSLEFIQGKQNALSEEDWSDRLVGSLPHFYYYHIANVGETVIAKRRTHAVIISHLNPPFMESKTRGQYKELMDEIDYYHRTNDNKKEASAIRIKTLTLKLGLDKDLSLDNNVAIPYSDTEIEHIENYAEEIANEKMTGRLYTLGQPYDKNDIESTVIAIAADPLAYSLARLDMLNGKITRKEFESNVFISKQYLIPAKNTIKRITLNKENIDIEKTIQQIAPISTKELMKAKAIERAINPNLSAMKEDKTGKRNSKIDISDITSEDREYAFAILEIQRTLTNVVNYKDLLTESPELELKSILNGLNGGYIAPSPGGDVVLNPNALPTGRNMFSINVEATPSVRAWNDGKELGDAMLKEYYQKHESYPHKVGYTFMSGEFIQSEGATVAQVLYMLGVEPVRDAMNRVADMRLIPSEELGRPRIDVIVQTSGQLRDLASSRLLMITKAVALAAKASDDKYPNYVAEGVLDTEKSLIDKGIPPKEAREMSTMRVFGAVNSGYGTGIIHMVEKGDSWETEGQLASTYINNMGAIYGSEENWGAFKKDLFETAMKQTDIVVQPRQSNTWGALSLDHIYEFMGGLNLSVRNVTGKDPETYMADYRNRNRAKMQGLKEAIGVESRTTILNPEYIKEKMKGGATSAQKFAKTFRNTYGWNVMKPDVIDNEFWNQAYNIYVKDSLKIGVTDFFEKENPAAMQEVTAVMLETARKGMWKATDQQLNDIAQLHTDLVQKYGASGTEFTGTNLKLQDYIAKRSSTESANGYKEQMQKMKSGDIGTNAKGMVLKKNEILQNESSENSGLNGIIIVSVVLIIFVILLILLKKKRKNNNE